MEATFLRHSWRAHWRSLLVLALLVGLTGGLTIAGLAGARRSMTSLERFEQGARTLDVFINADVTTPEPRAMAELLDGPLVEEANDLVYLLVEDEFGAVFARTSRRGLEIERGVLLEGRRADPDAPHEVVLSEASASALDKTIGDLLELRFLTPEQVEELFATGELPTSLLGPEVDLRVVGIARGGFDLTSDGADPGLTMTTPAFWERYGGEIGVGSQSHMVRLVDSPGAVDAFTDAIADAYRGEHLPSVNVGQGESAVGDAISVITTALLVVALLIVVAGSVWIASATARHQRLDANDVASLGALGATRWSQRRVLIAAPGPGLGLGLLLAVPVAVGVSPFLPVGEARRVDPDPGLHLDLVATLAGLAVLAAIVCAASIASAARLVSEGRRAERSVDRERSIGPGVTKALRPVPATGVRFALSVSRRASADVRPALVGSAVGVSGLVAILVVGASLGHLVDTPARWGTTWDVATSAEPLDREAVLDDRDIAAAAVLLYDEQLTIDGVEAISMTFDPVKGDLGPTRLDGRAPQAADEIALARDTLRDVGVSLGETVQVTSRSQLTEEMRVVGVIAFPTIGEPSTLAVGASLTAEGGQRLRLGDPTVSDDVGTPYLVIRWAPGVDQAMARGRLEEAGQPVAPPKASPEVQGLDDVRGFPLMAAAALVLAGVIATSHALVVTVRRRRRELGVLSSLGFAPRQRRAVVFAQATTIAAVALAVGVPLGILVGTLVWSALASSIGVATDSSIPARAIVLGSLAVVLGLNLIATWPAERARRLRVADALRAE